MQELNYQRKRVLITGAGGFIGSHLTEQLVRENADVSVLLHYNSRSDRGLLEEADGEIVSKVKIHWGDLTDPDCCHRAVKGMDVVFHLAALIAIPYSYYNPVHCFDVNTRGTVNLATACLRQGVSRLVHTSTSEVYGTPKDVPIYEDHPLQPQSPYAASKVAADVAVLSYVRSFNLPAAIIRPFNTFGPRQSARAIIPTIISQLLTSGRVRLGNLKPTRDFVYVADTVDGFLRAGLADGIEGEVIQLSSNQKISIGELAEVIASLMAVPLVIERDPDRMRPDNSEVFQLLGCAKKAKALLGWRLSVDFKQGLRQVIDYVSRSVSRYKPSENLI